MKIKSSQDILEELQNNGASPERILAVMMNRADRFLNYYEKTKKRLTTVKQDYQSMLRSTGRLITTKVDHIATDQWGSYTWYKNQMYRHNGDGIWERFENQYNHAPHYMAQHRVGKFKVELLLSEEDMPEVFTGVCKGSVMGKKVILAEGHMIGYDDEFELRKVKNAV